MPSDSIFRLDFHKSVEVQNPRLVCGHYMILSCVFVGLCMRVVFTDQIFREVPVSDYIQVSMYPTGSADLDSINEVVAQHRDDEFCRNPGSMAFQWDSGGEWMYDNYTCVDLCGFSPSEDLSSPCINQRETYLKEGQAQIMLVTEIEDSWFSGRNERAPDTSFQFVPTTEALGIGFTYAFNVPTSLGGRDLDLTSVASDTLDNTITGNSPTDVLTVLLTANDEVEAVKLPSASIDLTLAKMLEMAGEPNKLDSNNPLAGENMLPGLSVEQREAGPSYRISGVEIVLETNCHNRHVRDIGDDDEGKSWRSQWRGPICYIKVAFKESQWVSAERLHISDGGRMLHRYYHGVRVSFQKGGAFVFFDFNNIISAMIDGIVLLKMPKQIVLLFAIYCLGALSKIYHRVFYEPLDIIDQIGASAIRLMAQSADFLELNNHEHGIDRESMEERLGHTLKQQKDKIDEDELKELVEVCFQAVTDGHRLEEEEGWLQMFGDCFKAMVPNCCGKRKTEEETFQEFISLENFSVAYSCNDPVRVGAFVELFDKDRKLGMLERFFMPPQLKKRVAQQRAGVLRRVSQRSSTITATSLGNQSQMGLELEESQNTDENTGAMSAARETSPRPADGRVTGAAAGKAITMKATTTGKAGLKSAGELRRQHEETVEELKAWKDKEILPAISELDTRVRHLSDDLVNRFEQIREMQDAFIARESALSQVTEVELAGGKFWRDGGGAEGAAVSRRAPNFSQPSGIVRLEETQLLEGRGESCNCFTNKQA